MNRRITSAPRLSIDFKRDWAAILRRNLVACGYRANSSEEPEETCVKYFNVLKRRICRSPRTVLTSAEFTCPAEHVAGVNLIKQKAENGEDLAPHQSRRFMRNAAFNDNLLNDWGIHHFHLGMTVEESGFVSNYGALLYARVTGTHFYILDTLDHNSFSKKILVEILHSNWPDSISQFVIPGAIGLEKNPSDDEIKDLRQGGVDLFVQVADGTVYCPIGGGYTMLGVGVDVAIGCNEWWYLLREWETSIRDNVDSIIESARQMGVEVRSTLAFRLRFDRGLAYAVEINSGIGLSLDTHGLRWEQL